MDLDYRILRLYRSRRFDKCISLCGNATAEANRLRYCIKMRAMTIQAKVAGSHYEEAEYELASDALVDGALAKTARPGTAFQRTGSQNATGLHEKLRAATAGRAHTSATRARTARTALATAARAARAATALRSAGGDGAPVALTVLNRSHLASPLAKTLFEYVFYSEGDVRKAMEIAVQAQGQSDADWWWGLATARCHLALGMRRNAETCLRQALRRSQHVAVYLRLIAVYVALDQPLSAIQVCASGLAVFPDDTSLLVEQARIHDASGHQALALHEYRRVATHDPDNVEAVANIAYYNFYNDQPEIALRYYRRILATTTPNAELLNNVGLCCLSCHQLDAVGACFRHALRLAVAPDTRAELWFNLAHVALMAGDLGLAQRCLQVSVTVQSNFQPALVTLVKLREFLKKQRSECEEI